MINRLTERRNINSDIFHFLTDPHCILRNDGNFNFINTKTKSDITKAVYNLLTRMHSSTSENRTDMEHESSEEGKIEKNYYF